MFNRTPTHEIPDTPHIAIAEMKDGSVVTWMEKVADTDYLGKDQA